MTINIYDAEVKELQETWAPEFFVLWNLGNQCTYKCSYCPEKFHSGSEPFHSIESVQKFFSELPKSHVMFTGGEATFHNDFEKIVLEKPDHIDISVISNASRPIAFWERISHKLKTVILTYHSEYAQYDRFLATAELIYKTNKRTGRINLTMIPEKWDQCVEVYEKLTAAKLTVIPKPLLEDFGVTATKTLETYTPEQLEWISMKNSSGGFKSMKLLDKNGKLLGHTNQTELLSLKQTNFNNWLCYTNTRSMYVLPNGNVFMATCGQRIKLGTIYNGISKIPTEPFVCKQNFCWCVSDIGPRKIKL